MRSYAIVPLLSSAVLASPTAWGPGWGNPGWGGHKPSGGGWGWPWGHGGPPGAPSNAAAYFLYNDPAGASIVSLKIGPDGKLEDDPMKTSTGGMGSLQVESTGAPAMADTLGSQGSVCVKDNVSGRENHSAITVLTDTVQMLFTVNAGSDTVSMFLIDPQSPTTPKLVGSPMSTLGDFPISVDYSPELHKGMTIAMSLQSSR